VDPINPYPPVIKTAIRTSCFFGKIPALYPFAGVAELDIGITLTRKSVKNKFGFGVEASGPAFGRGVALRGRGGNPSSGSLRGAGGSGTQKGCLTQKEKIRSLIRESDISQGLESLSLCPRFQKRGKGKVGDLVKVIKKMVSIVGASSRTPIIGRVQLAPTCQAREK
jgi:hypothetical protein